MPKENIESPAVITEKSTGTVYVGCKLPNGIIFDELPSGRAVRLKGWYEPISKDAWVVTNDGAGVTAVHADLWQEVMASHGSHAAIKNGHIFVVTSNTEDAKAEARSRKSVKSGMEQSEQKDKLTEDKE